MTDVIKNKDKRIHSVADAMALYTPPPAAFTGKLGLEVEMALFQASTEGIAIPDAKTVMALHKELKEKGHDAQLEAAGVLEYASPPADLKDVAGLVARIKSDITAFEDAAADKGFTRAPFSILPTTTVQQALDNKISRERLEASLAVITEALDPSLIRIPLLTTGVQTSFSPKDNDELFRMAGRGYALTPLLIAATNSSGGYVENNPVRDDSHLRSTFYKAYGPSGGIAQSFLKASDPETFIRNHVEAVFDAPMFFAYDHDGALIRSTRDDVLTFRKLQERGLNTQTNFELAETFIYNDIKICNLRDETGQVVGKRLEVRAADSGLHQPISALLLTAALVPDGETGQKFDALLKEYGFTGNPAQDAGLLQSARDAVVNHGGKFMDVPFGRDPQTGAALSLRDFAADVAGLVVGHFAADKSLAADVSKLADILLTGECDAKVFATRYRSLGEVTEALKGMDAIQVAQTPKPTPMAAKRAL